MKWRGSGVAGCGNNKNFVTKCTVVLLCMYVADLIKCCINQYQYDPELLNDGELTDLLVNLVVQLYQELIILLSQLPGISSPSHAMHYQNGQLAKQTFTYIKGE